MPTKRGHLGKRGSSFVIQFSKPGFDVDTAPPEGLVFDSGTQRLRPLVSGITAALPTGNTNIPLPKTFLGLPLILVDMFYGTNGVRGPGRGFEVTYRRSSNVFTINNGTAGAVFSYHVFDNEMT
ncbi:hypothetical protein OSH10_08325 [Kaistia defluvii]|uniref:hypothetical protein n=1 Tax=Kaistia defluvii TaxID=410841 RepID=UPI0022582003|nr:hypothetical protein [Kaistia defluvii]MCX5518439.1 hypothetical protein [Kaistia defluvii]